MRSHALPELAYDERSLGRRRHGFGMMAAAALLLVIGIAALVAASAANSARQSAAQSARAAAPRPVWMEIVHPIALFDLAAPELAKLPLFYEARRNLIGGGRQDSLTFGQLNGPSPYVRLLLYRVGAEPAQSAPFYVDLARAAAQADLSISRSLMPAAMPTRYGPFEVADMTLAGDNASAVPCLGFRGSALAGKFLISGFACGGAAQPISRPALACLIDRLDLNEAGDDKDLAAFFAATELKRNPACMGTRLAPTAARASWLDQNDAPPPLKGKKLL